MLVSKLTEIQRHNDSIFSALAAVKIELILVIRFIAHSKKEKALIGVFSLAPQFKSLLRPRRLTSGQFPSTQDFLIHADFVGIDPLFTSLGKEIGGIVISQVVPSALTQI